MQVKDPQQQQQLQQQQQDKDRLTSSDPVVVRQWLERHNRKQLLALLDKFLMELRHHGGHAENLVVPRSGRNDEKTLDADAAASSSAAAKHRVLLVYKTVDLLKHLIGPTNWKSAAELLYLIRGVGREIHMTAAAATRKEPAIGNVIRRVMAAVREEALTSAAAVSSNAANNSSAAQATAADTAAGNRLTLQSMLWALPQQSQHVRKPSSGLGGGVVGGDLNLSSSGRSLSNLAEVTTTTSAVVVDSERGWRKGRRDYPEMYYNTKGSGRPPAELKQAVMEAIQEIVADLEDSHKNINEQATNHVHAGEVILICGGHSKTLELFLKAAAAAAAAGGNKKQRQQTNNATTTTSASAFQVICCEDAPGNGGHKMAESLAAAGIVTTVIPDAAVFAIMSRVHKVLIPAHAVLANGGLVACSSGCNMVALAARHNAVPVVCVTGIYKLCPLYPHDGQDTLNDLVSPSCIMDYATCSSSSSSSSFNNNNRQLFQNVELVNPIHDYIDPSRVTLYVTNAGSFQPSYIYRLLAEYYHHDDWESFD